MSSPDSATTSASVAAWRPDVPAITEVFHANFRHHVYPVHTHTVWTLLILDAGVLKFDLERDHHLTLRSQVVLLPPHIPHDGRTAAPQGFRKRVIYLAEGAVDPGLIGAAADRPTMVDPLLWNRVGQLHSALAHRGDAFEADGRLALIIERLDLVLRRSRPVDVAPAGRGLAEQSAAPLSDRAAGGDGAAAAVGGHAGRVGRRRGWPLRPVASDSALQEDARDQPGRLRAFPVRTYKTLDGVVASI